MSVARGRTKPAASGPVEGPWALPKEWRWELLPQVVEVCDFLRRPVNNAERVKRIAGKAHHELYPYFGATGQAGVIDSYLADGEYILLGEDGAPFLEPLKAKAYRVSGRFWVNNHAHVLKARPDLDDRLLLHWLNTLRYEPYVNGTTRLKLTQGAMEGIPVPVPPHAIQLALAERIDNLFVELDDGEAALARARADLGTWRKALLKAAVTGELTADWRAAHPPTETGADLLARILDERRARWQAEPRNKGKRYSAPPQADSAGLPDLPPEWAWATLSQLSMDGPTNGYSPARSTDGKGTLALKLTATTSGNLRLDDKSVKTIGETIPAGSPLFLRSGDLLFQRGNTREYVGMAAVYDGPSDTYIYPDLMIRIRTQSRHLTDWVWRWSISPHGRRYLMDAAQGGAGTMPKISGETLKAMPVPLPPIAEQVEVLRQIDAALSTESLSSVNDLSAANLPLTLRQSILAAAFRGDLVA